MDRKVYTDRGTTSLTMIQSYTNKLSISIPSPVYNPTTRGGLPSLLQEGLGGIAAVEGVQVGGCSNARHLLPYYYYLYPLYSYYWVMPFPYSYLQMEYYIVGNRQQYRQVTNRGQLVVGFNHSYPYSKYPTVLLPIYQLPLLLSIPSMEYRKGSTIGCWVYRGVQGTIGVQ